MYEALPAYCWHISMRPLNDFYRENVAFERLDSELRQSHRPAIFLVHPYFATIDWPCQCRAGGCIDIDGIPTKKKITTIENTIRLKKTLKKNTERTEKQSNETQLNV